MTQPRRGWRIPLALGQPGTQPPGWAIGLRFAEQSIPDADQLTPGGTPGGTLPGWAIGLRFAEKSIPDADQLTPGGTLPLEAPAPAPDPGD